MTENKDFKRVVRERAAKTGESYATARAKLEPGATARADVAALTVVRDQVVSQCRWAWQEFRPGLRGMTDDEFRWEPIPGCPTIHRHPDGTYRTDQQFPIHGAASIAQRVSWIGSYLLVVTNQHFGDKSVVMADVAEVPGTAREGIARFGDAVTAWADGLAACDPLFLLVYDDNRSPGSIDGQFPFIGHVTFTLQLLTQTCAHVSMARDLYLAAHPELVSSH